MRKALTILSCPSLIGGILMLVLASGPAAQTEHVGESLITQNLCGVLRNIKPGESLDVTVTGIYRSNLSLLFTPENRDCALDVQSSTYVEFSEHAKTNFSENFDQLRKFARKDSLVKVTLGGTISGPKSPGEDQPGIPALSSYANRSAASRYGFHYGFRTQFLVNSIESVQRHPGGDSGIRFHRHLLPEGSIKFLGAALPVYPHLARNIGIEGKVVIQAHIQDGKVGRTKILSGDRMLYEGDEGALANMQTWRFDPKIDRVITTAFIYRLELRPVEQRHRLEADFDLPRQVTIVGSALGW